jgi:transcriptional regulator with XRE-family HTH domain
MITGQQIRETREAKGWSRSELAAKLGIHHVSIRHAEDGKGNPEARKAILKALGLTEAPDSNGTVREVKQVEMINGMPADEWRAKCKAEVEEHNRRVEQDRLNDQDGDGCPPLVSAAEIDGQTTTSGIPIGDCDVVIPGSLVKAARNLGLTLSQTIAVCRIELIWSSACGVPAGNPTVDGWRSLIDSLKSWSHGG